MSNKKKRIAEATTTVESWLLAKETSQNSKAAHCEIVLWDEGPWGIRVAEVTYTSEDRMAGSSYMQSDLPYGLAVCAQVERVLLALLNDQRLDPDEEYGSLAYLLESPLDRSAVPS